MGPKMLLRICFVPIRKWHQLKTLTSPKLEHCGALLLARLAQKVIQSMDFNFTKTLLRVDSMRFIPHSAPGLRTMVAWTAMEAGVKSFKHHLKRVSNNTSLTFVELTTLLAQIESILNSRPLSPLSSDPSDLSPSTPAHCLIGKPLLVAPEKINRLTRFPLVQQMCQHFWRIWNKEYISELQYRGRWKRSHGQLQEGTLALVKDDHTPPNDWKFSRVLSLTKGCDGVG
ncbi:hypothetical protein Trydic_g18762 [Trypoxylus dichotomus]